MMFSSESFVCLHPCSSATLVTELWHYRSPSFLLWMAMVRLISSLAASFSAQSSRSWGPSKCQLPAPTALISTTPSAWTILASAFCFTPLLSAFSSVSATPPSMSQVPPLILQNCPCHLWWRGYCLWKSWGTCCPDWVLWFLLSATEFVITASWPYGPLGLQQLQSGCTSAEGCWSNSAVAASVCCQSMKFACG